MEALAKNAENDIVTFVRHCRNNSIHYVGYVICMEALESTRYDAATKHKLKIEATILAFYVDASQEGLLFSNDCLLSPLSTASERKLVADNLHFYCQPLRDITHERITTKSTLLPGWNHLNPSVCKHNGAVVVNLRLANSGYPWATTVTGQPISRTNPVRTENARALLSDLRAFKLFHCKHDLVPTAASSVLGLEDCRLFVYQGNVWFIATAREFSAQGDMCEMLVGNDSHLTRLRVPESFPTRHEKNWLAFEQEQRLRCIYSYEPFVVLEADAKTGDTQVFLNADYSDRINMQSFRGSAIFFSDTNKIYYVIVHEVSGNNNDRFYSHRVLKLTQSLVITHVSLPFQLRADHRIEYVCGAVEHDNDVIIAYSSNDSEPYLATMRLEDFDALCLPISTFTS